MNQIGTLNEKSLHVQLKDYLAQPGDQFEVPLEGSFIDIVRGEQLIEIQTRNFGALKKKMRKLVPNHKLHLVYPLAAAKWIVKQDANGKVISRRKSPKKGRVEHVFGELVYLPTLLEEPNFTLELLLIHEEEVRAFDAKRAKRRRRGWVTQERRLLKVQSRHKFETPSDLAQLLPDALPNPFTTADLAKALKQPRKVAQQMVYCLRALPVLEMVGKEGRSILYHRVETSA